MRHIPLLQDCTADWTQLRSAALLMAFPAEDGPSLTMHWKIMAKNLTNYGSSALTGTVAATVPIAVYCWGPKRSRGTVGTGDGM